MKRINPLIFYFEIAVPLNSQPRACFAQALFFFTYPPQGDKMIVLIVR